MNFEASLAACGLAFLAGIVHVLTSPKTTSLLNMISTTSKDQTMSSSVSQPGMTAPVNLPTSPVAAAAAEAVQAAQTVAAVAPAAAAAAVAAQAAVAAAPSVTAKAEAAASAAFTFALPYVTAANPALGASITGIFAALQAIEDAFAALKGHVTSASASTTSLTS